MAWVEKCLKDHLLSTHLLWAGLPATRLSCPEPHPKSCPLELYLTGAIWQLASEKLAVMFFCCCSWHLYCSELIRWVKGVTFVNMHQKTPNTLLWLQWSTEETRIYGQFLHYLSCVLYVSIPEKHKINCSGRLVGFVAAKITFFFSGTWMVVPFCKASHSSSANVCIPWFVNS